MDQRGWTARPGTLPVTPTLIDAAGTLLPIGSYRCAHLYLQTMKLVHAEKGHDWPNHGTWRYKKEGTGQIAPLNRHETACHISELRRPRDTVILLLTLLAGKLRRPWGSDPRFPKNIPKKTTEWSACSYELARWKKRALVFWDDWGALARRVLNFVQWQRQLESSRTTRVMEELHPIHFFTQEKNGAHQSNHGLLFSLGGQSFGMEGRGLQDHHRPHFSMRWCSVLC